MTTAKRSELESFWRVHLDGWRRSDLNQREYCELHGVPLKRFGNWRAKLKHEEPASAGKLLYRRGSGLRHMSSHMAKEIVPPPSGYIPSARSAPSGARRRFSEADKRRIVEEACRPGASVSGVARRYGIRQAGEIDYNGRISKCGDAMVRTLLYEAANAMLTRCARYSALKAWAMRIAKTRGLKRALARKLAVIMHRLWLDGSEFRWSDKASAPAH